MFLNKDLPDNSPTIVFLHEGLGSITQWKNFPEIICSKTNLRGLVYSRLGYGNSDSINTIKPSDFLHEEALITLPTILDKLNIKNPILLGHSDGASIGLIAAASKINPKGLIAIAPHLFLESITIQGVLSAAKAFDSGKLKAVLDKYHKNSANTFATWANTWIQPACKSWNIENYVDKITCPILAIQGHDDNYGTLEQIRAIQRLQPDAKLLEIPNCGHSPHFENSELVTKSIVNFISTIRNL